MMVRHSPAVKGLAQTIQQGLLCAIFSIVYALIPWQSFSGTGAFEDRSVYHEKISQNIFVSDEKELTNVFDFFTNEIVWDLGLKYISQSISVDTEFLFFCISALTIFVFSVWLAKPFGIASLILLINPLIVDFAFSQLRSAFAFCLLAIAFWLWRQKFRASGVCVTVVAAFIHSIIPLIILIYISANLIAHNNRNNQYSRSAMLSILLGVVFVIMLGPMRSVILTSIGDRRVDYQSASISLSYMSFWIFAAGALMISKGSAEYQHTRTTLTNLSIILVTIFVGLALSNLPSARFLVILYPIIMQSMLMTEAPIKLSLISAFIFYTTMQWIFWLGL
jgi:hypothetical protein